MAKKNPMSIDQLVSWIVKTRKRKIDESCGCGRVRVLTLLRDNPEQEIHSIHSDISDWKIRASDETKREIEDLDDNENLKVSQDVVSALKKIFKTEIDTL